MTLFVDEQKLTDTLMDLTRTVRASATEDAARVAEGFIEKWKAEYPDHRPDCYEAAEAIAAAIRSTASQPSASG